MPSKMQGQVETHQKFNNIEFIVSATTNYTSDDSEKDYKENTGGN